MRFGIAPDFRADRRDVTVQSSKRIAPYASEPTAAGISRAELLTIVAVMIS
jgi:hypothetical protein